jgi:hypothetical protein
MSSGSRWERTMASPPCCCSSEPGYPAGLLVMIAQSGRDGRRRLSYPGLTTGSPVGYDTGTRGPITTAPRYRSTGSPRTETGPPEQRPTSLLKPLGRSKEVRQRDSQECHGPSAALFPALSVIPSQDRADTQAPPQRQWPIQGRVTDISALCNANRFLGLVSPWRTTVWGLGTEPGITDCTPGPDRGRCART